MSMLKRINQFLAVSLLMCPGIIRVGGSGFGGLPRYSFTGNSTLVDEGDGNWTLRFLSSGTLTLYGSYTFNLFLLGGGGSGSSTWSASYGAGGGGAGYTVTVLNVGADKGTYAITVGAGGQSGGGGGSTSAFGFSAHGGYAGSYGTTTNGGNGGSGGGAYLCKGGSNGTNGSNYVFEGGTLYGGTGQGSTTREFGESTGTLYAYGGDGGGNRTANGTAGLGADDTHAATSGADNSGSGGGGRYVGTYETPGAGGSGIVVMRNRRAA